MPPHTGDIIGGCFGWAFAGQNVKVARGTDSTFTQSFTVMSPVETRPQTALFPVHPSMTKLSVARTSVDLNHPQHCVGVHKLYETVSLELRFRTPCL